MATKNDKKRPSSFYELVLSAPEDLALGFLSGLIIGADHDGLLAHGPDEDIAGPGLGDRLKSALHVHPQETHVVVDNLTRGLVKKKAG